MRGPRLGVVVSTIALCALAITASRSSGDRQTLKRLLPSGKEIRAGWVEAADSFQYGAGQDLTLIYNGGYQLYLDNGVLDAAQVGYRSKAGYCVLTIHTMKSAEACRKFWDYWRKEAADQGKLTAVALADSAFVYHPVAKTSYGYLRNGRYLLVTDVSLDGEIGRTVLRSFMGSVSRSATALQRPPRKRAKGA